jgi:hypothetical protein
MRIVLNLRQINDFLFCPTRFCLKIAPPFDSILTAAPIITMIGIKNTIKTAEKRISNIRFIYLQYALCVPFLLPIKAS